MLHDEAPIVIYCTLFNVTWHLDGNTEKFTGAGFQPATSWIPYKRSTNWAIQSYAGSVPISQLSLFVWQSEEIMASHCHMNKDIWLTGTLPA